MKLKSLTPSKLAQRAKLLAERVRGLDFMTTIQAEDVGLDPNYAFRSSPSGNRYLENALSDFNITSKDAILDIGCGKGSAMRTMLNFPFARVDGIELSEEISAIAIRNFKKLNASRANVLSCDASVFSNYDRYNFIYLYNPFPANVMLKVVNALIQSIDRSERELVIIYNNATCHETVVAQGVFTKKGLYPDQWGNGISIYTNRDDRGSRLSANKRMQPTSFLGGCSHRS